MTLKTQKLIAAIMTVAGIVLVIAGVPFGGLSFVAGLLWFAAVRILQ